MGVRHCCYAATLVYAYAFARSRVAHTSQMLLDCALCEALLSLTPTTPDYIMFLKGIIQACSLRSGERTHPTTLRFTQVVTVLLCLMLWLFLSGAWGAALPLLQRGSRGISTGTGHCTSRFDSPGAQRCILSTAGDAMIGDVLGCAACITPPCCVLHVLHRCVLRPPHRAILRFGDPRPSTVVQCSLQQRTTVTACQMAMMSHKT